MALITTVQREFLVDFCGELDRQEIDYEVTQVIRDGLEETRKIVYVSRNTGKTIYVRARYQMIAGDAIVETLHYHNSDFGDLCLAPVGSEQSLASQDQIDAVAHAFVVGDSRLTDWEREFVGDLIDRRVMDDSKKMSDRQMTVVAQIYTKIAGGSDGWSAPTIYQPHPEPSK